MRSGTTGAGPGPRAVGIVPTDGRGNLASLELGGRSLASLATWALSLAGVTEISRDLPWAEVQDMAADGPTVGGATVGGAAVGGAAVVLHDPLCPLVPADVLLDAVAASASGHVVAGCRAVTDTIKSVLDGVVVETVDRESLLAVASPIVLPPPVVLALADWPDTDDFAALVSAIRERFAVSFLEVPPEGRRVDDRSSLHVLASFAGLRLG